MRENKDSSNEKQTCNAPIKILSVKESPIKKLGAEILIKYKKAFDALKDK